MSGSNEYLSDAQMAEYYVQDHGPAQPGVSPVDLEAPVQRWLTKCGLGHRSAFAVAIQLVKTAKPAPLPTPEQANWAQNQMDGIGDPRPPSADAMLADRIRGMDMAAWAQERQRLGLYKSTLDHLSGGTA